MHPTLSRRGTPVNDQQRPAQLPATQTSRLAFKRKPLRAWFHGVAVATFAQSLIAGRNFPSTESVGTLDDRNPHSNMFALSPRPAQSSPIQGQQTLSL
ncbi:hypothetical protein VDGE_30254 [Verticillium dahliae]|uniref:Uncharacterized protein n=1 Tax=Verticillium dahliae TaxID=27337 RepID=A0A444S3X2_VERDA|nr:hypothetical protein VDGE_30254 [Verticillium dahliae]